MSPREALVKSEASAANNNQSIGSSANFVSNVGGKGDILKAKGGKLKKLGGISIITLILILVIIFLFINPSFQIDMISTMLERSTAAYYTDMTERKATVFEEALREGDVPTNTATRLKEEGVEVGYMQNGEFVESAQGVAMVAFVGDSLNGSSRGELVVKVGDKIVTADEFYNEYNSNATLYNALNNATYNRAAYYYDNYAEKLFRQIGTTRNDYSSDTDFVEVTSKLMGEGNNITIIDVNTKWPDCDDEEEVEEGEEKDEECDPSPEADPNSTTSDAAAVIVNGVQKKTKYLDKKTATLNAADSLAIADEITTEQRSMRFYVAVMQNISKVKAGYGGTGSGHDSILGVFSTLGAVTNTGSNINDVMNTLYQTSNVEVVDTVTGETKTITGSMLESPSLYSMLTEEKVNVGSVQDYSTERILRTVENINSTGKAGDVTLTESVALNKNKGNSGEIGRSSCWFRKITCSEESEDISAVTTTVASSLTENSFENVKGISGGELLAQGAVNFGAEMALASGSTVGDTKAINEYAKLTEVVLALDAESDRMNRSPLDISSKNTFLGSIMYKFAVASIQSGSLLNKVASVSRVTASSIVSLLPNTYADDDTAEVGYMTSVGECERYDLIGASGTAGCSRNEVFDTSTYGGKIFQDEGFKKFREENLECDNSMNCSVIEDSKLEEFLKYNMKREAPIGVMDASVLDENNSFIEILKNWFLGDSEDKKKKASGAEYVNSEDNSNWDSIYRYAQTYQSINRAIQAMRKYDGDTTAYNFEGFGINDPIIAWINENYPEESMIANN